MKNTLEFDKPDFVDLMNQVGENFKRKLNEPHLVIPAFAGNGFVWAEKLPCGISVMVMDVVLTEDLVITRRENHDENFLLQFKEIFPVENNHAKGKNQNDEIHSSLKLTHTSAPENFLLPAGLRLRSVKFFFNKAHLSALLSKEAAEEMLIRHFPLQVASDTLEPIATEFRITLNDLLVQKIDQPLRLNYIQNRVMMLLEKYFIRLHSAQDRVTKKVKRSDDETSRLMKVETLLVKNFAVSPPTIDELSRISAMSPTKLKNDFKALYGMPIYEYYQKNRMLKAKSLLLQGKFSIKEVGIQVGYSNLSHFANTFKKEFGFLPSEMANKDGVVEYN